LDSRSRNTFRKIFGWTPGTFVKFHGGYKGKKSPAGSKIYVEWFKYAVIIETDHRKKTARVVIIRDDGFRVKDSRGYYFTTIAQESLKFWDPTEKVQKEARKHWKEWGLEN